MNKQWIKMSVLVGKYECHYRDNLCRRSSSTNTSGTIKSNLRWGGEVSSLSTDTTSSSSVNTDASTQASEAQSKDVAPANSSGANQAASALQKKKVMLVRRQIYKKYLLQMNVNTL